MKIRGPIYNNIVQNKDLVADILPPPEFIIESYLVVLQALNETEAKKINEYKLRFGKLRQEYDERRAFWTKELGNGKMKEMLVSESYRPAKEFFDAAMGDYFPALVSLDHEKARSVAYGVLKAKFEEHHAVIDNAASDTLTYANKGSEVVENTVSEVRDIANTVSETISGDIETVANVSHETSAGSEQIAKAALDLTGLASGLQKAVGQFRM